MGVADDQLSRVTWGDAALIMSISPGESEGMQQFKAAAFDRWKSVYAPWDLEGSGEAPDEDDFMEKWRKMKDLMSGDEAPGTPEEFLASEP